MIRTHHFASKESIEAIAKTLRAIESPVQSVRRLETRGTLRDVYAA